MRIAIIVGTRPEIIKMSPVIRACEEQELPGARYNLDVGSNSHGKAGNRIIAIITRCNFKYKEFLRISYILKMTMERYYFYLLRRGNKEEEYASNKIIVR